MVKDEEYKLKQGKNAAFKQIKTKEIVQVVKSLKQLTVRTVESKPSIYKYKEDCSLKDQIQAKRKGH